MFDAANKLVSVRQRAPNKLATTNITNELAATIEQLGQIYIHGGDPRRHPWPDDLFWMVVTAGPDSEADYTDERYWLQLAYMSNPDGDPETSAATFDLFPLGDTPKPGMIITATNLSEVIGHTHTLPVNFPIMDVRRRPDTAHPMVMRYVFQISGGGLEFACGTP